MCRLTDEREGVVGKREGEREGGREGGREGRADGRREIPIE